MPRGWSDVHTVARFADSCSALGVMVEVLDDKDYLWWDSICCKYVCAIDSASRCMLSKAFSKFM